MKYIFTALIGSLVGIGFGYLMFVPPKYSTAEEHFDQVHTIVWDGSASLNKKDQSAGLTNNIRKLEFHLHRLEEMGEVHGVDLIVPTVNYTREVYDFIRNYDLSESGVVELSMNPQYVAFPLAADVPLHLNLWYRTGYEDEIRQFLEAVYQEFGDGGPLFRAR